MAMDSGDTAMMGLVIGGAAGHVLSDGDPIVTILGAGAGWAIGGPGGSGAGFAQAVESAETDAIGSDGESDPDDENADQDTPTDLRDADEFKVDDTLD